MKLIQANKFDIVTDDGKLIFANCEIKERMGPVRLIEIPSIDMNSRSPVVGRPIQLYVWMEQEADALNLIFGLLDDGSRGESITVIGGHPDAVAHVKKIL